MANFISAPTICPTGGAAISAGRYGFTGQEKDSETGLYNYNARLYDPAIAVFTTADSVVPDPGSVMGYHRYGYCFGNPLRYTDASGHHPLAVIAVAAAWGAFISAANGGDFGDILGGALIGAAFSAFTGSAFSVAGDMLTAAGASIYTQAAVHFAIGGIAGGMTAAMTRQDIGAGALAGAFSAGLSKFVGGKLGTQSWAVGNRYAMQMAVGGMAGAVAASITGENPITGFIFGAAMAAIAQKFNGDAHRQNSDELWRKWMSEGREMTSYGEWKNPIAFKPSENNIAAGVYLPGRADIQWEMTVTIQQQGHWDYFGGLYSGQSYLRTVLSQTLYYVVEGGGFIMPSGGYYAVIVRYGSPPSVSEVRYAMSKGY